MEVVFELAKCTSYGDYPLCYKLDEGRGINIRIYYKSDVLPSGYSELPEENEVNIEHIPQEITGVIKLLKAVLQAKKILQESQKGNNPTWDTDFKNVLSKYDTGNYIGLLVQSSLIQKDSKILYLFMRKMNMIFFGHLAKSLLNAEYLFLDNYSELLDEILSSETEGYDLEDGLNLPRVVFPYQVKSFIMLACHLKDMCFRIRKILEDEPKSRIELDTDPEEEANSKLLSNIIVGEGYTAPFGKLLKSIVDMTMIDHAFKTNDKNVEKLVVLLRRLKHVEFLINKYDDNKNKKSFELILQIVKSKASSMLCTLYTQKNDYLTYKFYFTAGYEHDIDIKPSLQKHAIEESVAIENKYIKERLENKNKQLRKDKLPQIDKYARRKDVNSYNDKIEKGITTYCETSSIIEKIKSGNPVEECVSEIRSFYNCYKDRLSPSFFVSSIAYVEKQLSETISDNDSEMNKRIDKYTLLGDLLSGLSAFISLYKHSLPLRYAPPFASSFYKKEEDYSYCEIKKNQVDKYNYHNFEKLFFFASLYSSPLNIDFLNRFYECYIRKNNQHGISFYNAINKSISDQINKLNIQNEKFKEDTINIKENIQKENQENRQQTMQSLGVFAAFLAFVTIAVGLTKIAQNVHEFILFCSTYTLSLCVFVALIKEYAIEKDPQKMGWYDKHHNSIRLI